MARETFVVKVGGAAMNEAATVLDEVASLHLRGAFVALVHGGGPEIDIEFARRGIRGARVGGHRVTDAGGLDVVESVLCATINKRFVRALLSRGAAAAGISGEDGGTLVAERMPGENGVNLGFVGRVTRCDPALVLAVERAGYIPVVAPLAVSADGTHAYNVNADLAAAALAGALGASAFVCVTDVPRVLLDPDDASSGIERMTVRQANAFGASSACRSSMKPKVFAAAAAVVAGAKAAYICSPRATTIASALAGDATTISADTPTR